LLALNVSSRKHATTVCIASKSDGPTKNMPASARVMSAK